VQLTLTAQKIDTPQGPRYKNIRLEVVKTPSDRQKNSPQQQQSKTQSANDLLSTAELGLAGNIVEKAAQQKALQTKRNIVRLQSAVRPLRKRLSSFRTSRVKSRMKTKHKARRRMQGRENALEKEIHVQALTQAIRNRIAETGVENTYSYVLKLSKRYPNLKAPVLEIFHKQVARQEEFIPNMKLDALLSKVDQPLQIPTGLSNRQQEMIAALQFDRKVEIPSVINKPVEITPTRVVLKEIKSATVKMSSTTTEDRGHAPESISSSTRRLPAYPGSPKAANAMSTAKRGFPSHPSSVARGYTTQSQSYGSK
jgi:hypothetical protein